MTLDLSRIPLPAHLAPEDAALYLALYAERNTVSRGEAARVRHNTTAATVTARPFRPFRPAEERAA